MHPAYMNMTFALKCRHIEGTYTFTREKKPDESVSSHGRPPDNAPRGALKMFYMCVRKRARLIHVNFYVAIFGWQQSRYTYTRCERARMLRVREKRARGLLFEIYRAV